MLEDLHWADGASLALLEHLLTLTDQAQLLVIIAMRPVRAHGSWQVRETAMRAYGHRHTDLSLGPLLPSESEASVRSFLLAGGRGKGVDANLVRQVQQRAEGNPFFAAEIVRSLVGQEAIAQGVPATIEGVLTARIDRLPSEARRVLQLAAVVGRIFSYELLLDIVSGEAPGFREGLLNGALLELLRAQLIREQVGSPDLTAGRPSDRMFTFEHQLTLEAAYRSLLHRKRRVLHRRVAEAWERLYPDQAEAQLGLLAYHWEQAGDSMRAVDYLQRAGRRAASQYANDEAIEYLSRGLRLVPERNLPVRYDLLLERERVYDLKGDRKAVAEDLDRLQVMAEELGSLRKLAEVALQRARRSIRSGRTREAIDDMGLVAQAADGAYDLSKVKRDRSTSSVGRADLDDYWRVVDLADAAGALDIEGLALREYGLRLLFAGRGEEGLAVLERGLAVYREAGDIAGEANILNALAVHSFHAGDYDRAACLAEQGVRLEREVGNRFDEGHGLHILGWIYCASARYAEADAALTSAAELSKEVRAPVGLAGAIAAHGELYADLGMYTVARSAYLEATKVVQPSAAQDVHQALQTLEGLAVLDILPLLQAWAGLAFIDCMEGQPEEARIYGEKVIAALSNAAEYQVWHSLLRVRSWLAIGYAWLSDGKLDQAQATYQRISEFVRDPGVHIVQRPNLRLDVRAGLAAVAMARNDLTQALSEVETMVGQLLAGDVGGTLEPMQICLTSYRVLLALHDPRAAEILKAGYRVLERRLATITDDKMRRSYLENVGANREIAALWRAYAVTSED